MNKNQKAAQNMFSEFCKDYPIAAYYISTQRRMNESIREFRLITRYLNADEIDSSNLCSEWIPVEDNCQYTANMILSFMGISTLLQKINAKKILPLPICTNQTTVLQWVHGNDMRYREIVDSSYNGFNEKLYKWLCSAPNIVEDNKHLVPILYAPKPD